MASEKKNSSKLYSLNWILGFAIILFITLISFYFIYVYNSTTNEKGDWGTFGDFVGGTLNPLFALFSLFAIIYTIKIQTQELEFSREELEATRKELTESRIAQQEQSESLKLQNEATKLQMFENTFFQLLNQHNQYLDLVVKENIKIEYIKYVPFPGNTSGRKPDGLKPKKDVLSSFGEINQSNRVLKNYFMTLFQILKYINEFAKRNEINAKFYTNIIRALIDDKILRLLAINCVAYSDFIEYKNYIEEYAFFEHIYLEKLEEETNTILEILLEYELSAFDKNTTLVTFIKEAKTAQNSAFVEAKV
jgi:hypothetical protein